MFERVHAVINPASGSNQPILNTLNDVFQDAGIDWEVSITRQAGDAARLARAAAEAGADVVAVYGGDGTVLEAASGLHETGVPMAILPGGTANVLSIELGIPSDLAQAARLLAGSPHMLRPVDMGTTGEQMFFHLGIGFEGHMIQEANRGAKDRSGGMAYIFSALRQMSNLPVTQFRLQLDGEEVETGGINCMVTNYGSIGVAGLKLSHTISLSDGLLDVIVIRKADLSTFLAATANAITRREVAQALLQWQVREVTITPEGPQAVSVDGELLELDGPLTARIVPGAVSVVVPDED
jgi:diacylglycerol kinase (ATP)